MHLIEKRKEVGSPTEYSSLLATWNDMVRSAELKGFPVWSGRHLNRYGRSSPEEFLGGIRSYPPVMMSFHSSPAVWWPLFRLVFSEGPV